MVVHVYPVSLLFRTIDETWKNIIRTSTMFRRLMWRSLMRAYYQECEISGNFRSCSQRLFSYTPLGGGSRRGFTALL